MEAIVSTNRVHKFVFVCVTTVFAILQLSCFFGVVSMWVCHEHANKRTCPTGNLIQYRCYARIELFTTTLIDLVLGATPSRMSSENVIKSHLRQSFKALATVKYRQCVCLCSNFAQAYNVDAAKTYLARDSIMLSALYAIARPSVCLSHGLSPNGWS